MSDDCTVSHTGDTNCLGNYSKILPCCTENCAKHCWGGQSLRGSSDHLPIHPKLIIKMKEPETAVSPSLGLISVAYCMCGVLIVFGMTGC